MTSPSFNPYHEWLGIDPSISAPDHYQLIGVPRDEQNPETISRAADAAMSRVRQVRPGDKSQEWARVLDELREAKSCLTNQGRRGEYDRQLPPATRPEPSAMAPTNNASPSASNYSPSSQAPTTDSPHAPTAGSPMASPSNSSPIAPGPSAPAHDVGQPASNWNASPMATPATAYGQPANAWPNANVPMAGYSPAANPTPAANSTPMASPVPMAGYATPMPSQAPYAGHPAPMASPAIGQATAMSGYGNAPYANANYGMYPGFSPAPFAQPNGGSVVTSPQQAAPQAVSAWGQSPYGVASPQQAPMASAVPTAYAPALGGPAIGYASPAAPSASPSPTPSPSSAGAFDPMAPFDPSQMDKPASGPTASVATAVAAAQTGLPMGKTVSPASPPSGAEVSAKTSVGKVARKRANQGRHLPALVGLAALMVLVTAGVLYSVLGNPSDDKQVAQGQPSGNRASIPAAAPAVVDRSVPNPVSSSTRPTPTSVSISSDDDATPSATESSGDDAPDGSSMGGKSPSGTSPSTPSPIGPVNSDDPFEVGDPNLIEGSGADANPAMTQPTEPDVGNSPDSSTPAPEPTPTPTPDPTPSPAPTPMPEPAEMPTMQEVQALAKALSTAREALGEMNLDIADAELAKAQPLAKLPAHQAKLDRLKQLTHYTREFRHALEESLKGLQAGQSIPISESTVVAVVEANANTLIIKVAGVTRRYPVNELPLGLAVALADMWLDQGQPSSQLVKGAFVVAHKKASADNIAKARGWWEEAAARGLTLVNDLMPVIEDRYDNLADDLK